MPGSLDVAELLATIRHRVLSRLARRGIIEDVQDLTLLPSEAADDEPALSQLSLAAVSGFVPAGPELRQRAPLRLLHAASTAITGPLCATDSGFSLHAATVVARDNAQGKQALLRYVLRPPLAQHRLQRLPDGLCRLHLKRPFSDGTVAIDLDPLSLLGRLAAAIPAPNFNTIRYGGVLAASARLRPAVIPKLAETTDPTHDTAHSDGGAPQQHPRPRRSGYRPWAELLKRAFDLDLRCPGCNAVMKLKSLLTSPRSLRPLLTRLGEPTEVPGKAPARDPPYFTSRALRRRFGEPPQLDIFD